VKRVVPAGAMADVGDAEEGGGYMSDAENDEGGEEHLIASKRRAALSNWLNVSEPSVFLPGVETRQDCE